MAQYEVLKPFMYVKDGKAVIHRDVGTVVELDGSTAQKARGKVKRVGKGDPDADEGTVYDRSEAIAAAQETEHPDPAPEPVAYPEDAASPAEVELAALPEPDEEKPKRSRKSKGANGENES